MNFEIGDILFNLGIPAETLLVLLAIQFPFWVWSVVYIAKKRTKEPTDRVVWLLIVLLLGILGTMLYFAFGRAGKLESEIDSKKGIKDFEEWKKSDHSRAYLSPEDQRSGFEAYQNKTESVPHLNSIRAPRFSRD
jgi:hypothetical protein